MAQLAEHKSEAIALPVWVVAALCHFAALALCVSAHSRFPGVAPFHLWFWMQGIVAALMGMAAGLQPWWLVINLLFAPAAHAAYALSLPAEIYLGLLVLLLLVNVAAWRHRVPLFLSSDKVITELSRLTPAQPGQRFLDLGCGTGTVLGRLPAIRPDVRYDGIETAPVNLALAWWRTRHKSCARVRWGNFWRENLGAYSVVYAYLSPEPMAKLWRKAQAEMKPGSLFISNSFEVPGVAADEVRRVNDRMNSVLYVWRM